MHDKAMRMENLVAHIALPSVPDAEMAAHAAKLAKADLVSHGG